MLRRALIFFLAAFLFSSTVKAQVQFENVTATSGITYDFKSWGCSWGDLNGDGYPDLFTSNHYREADSNLASIWINQTDGTFLEVNPDVNGKRDLHGGSWMDFDNDGDEDLLILCGGVSANILLENDGAGNLTEVAGPWNIEDTTGRGRTALYADFDLDGKLDIFLGKATGKDDEPPASVHLQRDGFFEHVNDLADFNLPESALFATMADMNGDKKLDLLANQTSGTVLYNIGVLPFDSMWKEPQTIIRDILPGDLNGDLKSDVYLIRRTVRSEIQFLEDGTLKAYLQPDTDEVGLTIACDSPITVVMPYQLGPSASLFSFGLGGYGLPDLYSFELDPSFVPMWGLVPYIAGVDAGIYIGYEPDSAHWKITYTWPEKSPGFVLLFSANDTLEITSITNVPEPVDILDDLLLTVPGGFIPGIDTAGIGFDLASVAGAIADFDNDMDLDIYTACAVTPPNIPNKILVNQGDGTFVVEDSAWGAFGTNLGQADCISVADYDLDGFIDVFVTNGQGNFDTGPYELFRNGGNDNNWIMIDLVGTTSNRDAIGARVELWIQGKGQLREQYGGMHIFSQQHKRIHFGLGPFPGADSICITWPSGLEETYFIVPGGQVVEFVEGQAGISGIDDDLVESAINVFPNPVSGQLNVQHNFTQVPEWSLINIQGSLVESGLGEIGLFSVDVSSLPSGTYFLQLRNGAEFHVREVEVLR